MTRREKRWIEFAGGALTECMRKHSFQSRRRPLQPEKHQKLPARLRRAFGFILRDRILLHILAVVVMTKAGRKNGRISKRRAVLSHQRHAASQSIQCLICATCSPLEGALNILITPKARYDGIPSSHIIRGLPRNARALPFARRPHHLNFVVGLTPTSEPVLFRARSVPPAKHVIHELRRSVFHSVSVLLVRETGVVLSCQRLNGRTCLYGTMEERKSGLVSPTSNEARENLFIWQPMMTTASTIQGLKEVRATALQSSSDARFDDRRLRRLEQVDSFSPAYTGGAPADGR